MNVPSSPPGTGALPLSELREEVRADAEADQAHHQRPRQVLPVRLPGRQFNSTKLVRSGSVPFLVPLSLPFRSLF